MYTYITKQCHLMPRNAHLINRSDIHSHGRIIIHRRMRDVGNSFVGEDHIQILFPHNQIFFVLLNELSLTSQVLFEFLDFLQFNQKEENRNTINDANKCFANEMKKCLCLLTLTNDNLRVLQLLIIKQIVFLIYSMKVKRSDS